MGKKENQKNKEKLNTVTNCDMEIGGYYLICLQSGTAVMGVVVSKGEQLTQNGKQKYYRVIFDNTKYIDLFDHDISQVYMIDPLKKTEYLKEFGEEHNIKCFDENNKLLCDSAIISNVLNKNLWESLSETEREEFIETVSPDTSCIIDLMDAYLIQKKEYERLYEKRMELLDSSLEFMRNFANCKNMSRDMEDVYNFFYNELGIRELIENI